MILNFPDSGCETKKSSGLLCKSSASFCFCWRQTTTHRVTVYSDCLIKSVELRPSIGSYFADCLPLVCSRGSSVRSLKKNKKQISRRVKRRKTNKERTDWMVRTGSCLLLANDVNLQKERQKSSLHVQHHPVSSRRNQLELPNQKKEALDTTGFRAKTICELWCL